VVNRRGGTTTDAALANVVLSSVNAAAGAASQEAGNQAWQGLVALVRRAHHKPDAVVELEHAQSLAATLIETAGRDPQFDADLRGWIDLVARMTSGNGSDAVSNTIGDDARITGNVVQARDVTGPITFH